MKITLEQVEQLRERSNCTYEDAKIALEQSDGNVLDALILLEKAGMVKHSGGGFFSTKGQPRSNLTDFILTKETDEETGKEEHKVSVSAYLRAAGATVKDVSDDIVGSLRKTFKKEE